MGSRASSLLPVPSHVASTDGVGERGDGVFPCGYEFLSDVAIEACIHYRLHDGRVIEFLGFVDLVASGYATGVVVPEVGVVFADGFDHVAVHDLHVKNIVEQLEMLGTDLFD